MVLIGKKWLNSGKNGCIQAKVVVFRQSGLIRINRLYSGKSGGIRAKDVQFGQ